MKYVKQKLPGFKSGINYDDLESEIARFEKERQSAENEHKLVHERLASLLETNDWDKAEFEGVWRDSEKIDFKLIYLTRLVDHCQMIKDGTISPPKPRTDRAWSDDPIFDRYLENQYRKRKEKREDPWDSSIWDCLC